VLSCPHRDSRTAPGSLHTLLPAQDTAHPRPSLQPLLSQTSSHVPPHPGRAATTLPAPPEPEAPGQGRVLPSEPLGAARSGGDSPPSTSTATGGGRAREAAGGRVPDHAGPQPCLRRGSLAPRGPDTPPPERSRGLGLSFFSSLARQCQPHCRTAAGSPSAAMERAPNLVGDCTVAQGSLFLLLL